MNALEKIMKLQKLKEEIKQKKIEIKEKEKELMELQAQYDAENTSELPILLFLVNQTLPMPDDEYDYQYEYIYYCPDLDDIKCFTKHRKNEFLPNTIDLRAQFESLGMPKRVWPADAYNQYFSIVMQATSILESQIEELFQSNGINSWSDLGKLLTKEIEEKGKSKVLK
ncbi:MAG: hypothetical protein HFH31_03525 [Bacilli bacterium]|nr:hypothetical protein [Bacilli bacterium]